MTNLNNDEFQRVCKSGDRTAAQILYYSDTKFECNCHEALINACDFGHLAIVQWLFEARPDLNCELNLYVVLETACGMGHIDIVKYLIETFKFTTEIYDLVFEIACINDKLTVAQLLYPMCSEINYLLTFVQVCEDGYLTMAQWLKSVCLDFAIHSDTVQTYPAIRSDTVQTYPAIRSDTVQTYPAIRSDTVQTYRDDNYDAFVKACMYGHLHIIQWLHQVFKISIKSVNTGFNHACRNSNLDVVQWLKSTWPNLDHRELEDAAFCAACDSGRLETAKWLKENWPEIDHRAPYDDSAKSIDYPFQQACAGGHLELVEWLLVSWPDIDISVDNYCGFRLACIHGHLTLAKYLIKTYSKIYSCKIDGTYERASKSSNLQMMKWLKSIWEISESMTVCAFTNACAGGKLDIAQWLASHLPSVGILAVLDSAFNQACINGHSLVIIWLKKTWHGINHTKINFDQVFKSGHFDIIKNIYEIWPSLFDICGKNQAFRNSCENGHLDLAQLIIAICPDIGSQQSAFNLACSNNHLKTAMWLNSMWPDIDYGEAFIESCGNGHIQTTKWIRNKTTISNDNVTRAFIMACRWGKLLMLQYLYKWWPDVDYKYRENEAFIGACTNGHLSTAKWLKKNFLDINQMAQNNRAFRGACINNHVKMARWLKSSFPNINHTDYNHEAITTSCRKNNESMVLYILELYDKTTIIPVINLCFEKLSPQKVDKFISHIILHFNIRYMQIKEQFQEKFDLLIRESHKRFSKTKAARH